MEPWSDIDELLNKVEDLLEIGFYDEARAALEQGLIYFPNDWEVTFLLARTYSDQGEPHKAIPFLQQGLRLDRTNLDCLLGMYYAHVQRGQLKKAAHYLLRAAKYHPRHEAVLSAQIWYYTESMQFDKARQVFAEIQKNGFSATETLRNGAMLFERLGEYDHVIALLSRVLSIDPRDDETRDLLADHYSMRGELGKSIELYQQHLILSPYNIRTMSRLVFSLSQDNQLKKAEELAVDIIKRYPNSPVGYVDCAYVFIATQQIEKAIEAAEKAIGIAPLDAEAYRVKALAHGELSQHDQALKAFTDSMKLDPQNPEIQRDYYHHLRSMGDFNAMEHMVNTVIKQETPYCVEDYWFLADYFREQGNNRASFSCLHKAYRTMPGEEELIPPLVDIMLDEGHVSFAIPHLLHYIQKKGWNETAHSYMAHRRLRNKSSQEGLRLLRFFGTRPYEYRRFVFAYYLEHFIIGSLGLITGLAALYCGVVFQKTALAAGLLIGFTALTLLWKGALAYARKHIIHQPPPAAS